MGSNSAALCRCVFAWVCLLLQVLCLAACPCSTLIARPLLTVLAPSCHCVLVPPWRCLQGQLLDELDQEIDGTSTRLQAAQVSKLCWWAGAPGGWVRGVGGVVRGMGLAGRSSSIVTAHQHGWHQKMCRAAALWPAWQVPCCALLQRSSYSCPATAPLPLPLHVQRKIDYVLQKAGAKGQLAIIGFLILVLIILIFLLLG